jgi:DNA-directed RNA polymerase subunit M/transcription elongation factor TFIIS
MDVSKLNLIVSKPENVSLFKKYLEEEDDDLIYEIGFMIKSEKMTLKHTLEYLKNKKLGFFHPNFDNISKRIIEMDHFMDKPFEAEEGVNTCNKCSSKRTISYSRQTRSGDEGMTVYVFCIDCKSRYTMNS